MIIKKLHIENFGKLSNFDLDFDEKLNEVYHENGWGKSTLVSFVKAMFYSLPARARGEDYKYERPRFAPWQGGKYGGFMEYESEGKVFRITRYFEKTPENDFFELKDLQTNKIVTYEGEKLGDRLFGLGRDSFEVTALFPQLNFISSSTVQITANLTGLNKFQNDMGNLDNALKILDAKITAVKKEKIKKDEIDGLKRKIIENESFVNDEIARRDNLNHQLDEIIANESMLNLKLGEENKQFSLLSHSFDKKMALQQELGQENAKLNEVLTVSNILKDQKLGERGKNQNQRLKYFIPIPFAIVLLALIIFTATKVIGWVVGVVASIVIALLGVGAVILVVKYKKDKQTRAKLKDLDKKIKENDEQIKAIKKDINTINEQLVLFDGLETPDRQGLEELENQSTQTKLQRLTLENEMTNITESIDRLIEMNEKLQNDYDQLNEKNNAIDEKINTLQLTKEFMTNAKENVSKRFIVPVNEKLKGILAKFAFENKDFVVDTSWKVKENTNFGTKDFEYSSQGFQDIISFCQRINLIQDVYKNEKPIIILDDTFVNLDDKNLNVAKKIVKEISNDYQVLYICCHKRCLINKQ